ncbi:hypothetical protein [Paraburkholderia aromaticivorans]|uniref:hypothetical protein n=1 Tax=Paraburkholderia aromaticivorans TaxID=2026199 RepID=UPI001455EDCF|nr:hypothetical protein [Paraburkholderia aromaticivorans]
MNRLAITLMFFAVSSMATAAPKWVGIDKDDYVMAAIDASSVGRLADGRVTYWLKMITDVGRSSEGKDFTYLYTAKCDASGFEVRVARAYDNNKLTCSDGEPRKSPSRYQSA